MISFADLIEQTRFKTSLDGSTKISKQVADEGTMVVIPLKSSAKKSISHDHKKSESPETGWLRPIAGDNENIHHKNDDQSAKHGHNRITTPEV